jgi:hypothetical protein
MQKGTDATTEERGGQLIAKKDAVRARPGSGRRGATMSASGSDLRGPTVELLRVALNRTEMVCVSPCSPLPACHRPASRGRTNRFVS